MQNRYILQPKTDILLKLVTFVPKLHSYAVREALFAAGAGQIGNYDSCSFNTEGIGTFRAGEEAEPFVGMQGELHSEKTQNVLSGYAEQLFELGVDTVIMGCTHYPILLPVLRPLLEDKIQVVDPATLIPRLLEGWERAAEPGRADVVYQVSGEPAAFEMRAERFLGQPVSASQVLLRPRFEPEPATP